LALKEVASLKMKNQTGVGGPSPDFRREGKIEGKEGRRPRAAERKTT